MFIKISVSLIADGFFVFGAIGMKGFFEIAV